jgi:radical S-adenosyl methionine domain-containing protein 2
MEIRSVNFHILRSCDAACRFCFATFREDRGRLSTSDAERVIDLVRRAGAEKLNFAGGEPTLHPDIGRLVRFAKSLGLTTSLITKGRKLGALLDECADALDWVGLSIDSGDEAVQKGLGRGTGDHVARCIALADRCRALGIRVKLNTVVTAATWCEDMTWLVRRIAPERWKVFQVLRVVGENDGDVEPLMITSEQYDEFIERHRDLGPVAESNAAMTDSYAMIDPMGRFYGNTGGIHRVSAPILDVGVHAALASVGFVPSKLEARDGIYEWAGQSRRVLPVVRS